MKESAGRMKILVIMGAALFPIKGMSQVRVFQQLRYLAKYFEIDYCELCSNQDQITMAQEELTPIIHAYWPVRKMNFGLPKLVKKAISFIRKLRYDLGSMTIEELQMNEPRVVRNIVSLIAKNNYDVVIIHYWYQGILFNKISKSVKKMIDTHYAVEENIEIYRQGLYAHRQGKRFERELNYSLFKQNEYFQRSDALIVNSFKQKTIIERSFPNIDVIVVPNGQDLESYLTYTSNTEPDSILFYGSLSNQFNQKGLKRLLERIMPHIRKEHPRIKLYIVGSNPPDFLSKYQGNDVIVTGFVQDIRPIVSRCLFLMLPLDTASGFRGRCIEVMALGVPIIGTLNALDSLQITQGIQGFIAESDEEMVKYALEMITDRELRNRVAEQARSFVEEHYSLDATFGVLKAYLDDLSAS